ncbi:MAG: hypothetical protein IPO40_13720 [Fibrobacteres bacterium]|nr:hypothetical protein [Fibrobacterota bacterium]
MQVAKKVMAGILSTSMTFCLMGCGFFSNCPPEPPETFLVHCPTCHAEGIDSLEINAGFTGGIPRTFRKIPLDAKGNAAAFKFTAIESKSYDLWFGAKGVPLICTRSSYPEQDVKEMHLVPHDWGPSPFLDTLITIPVRDKDPQPVRWSAAFHSDTLGVPLEIYLASTVLPESDGAVRVHVPKFFAATAAPTTKVQAFADYRGVRFKSEKMLNKALPPIQWPPVTEGTFAPEEEPKAWLGLLSNGDTLAFSIWGKTSPYQFHRALIRGSNVIEEDSGTWDISSKTATFLRRGPGLSSRSGLMPFDPQRILDSSRYSLWLANEPSVASAVRSTKRDFWRYFVKPKD